MVIRLIEKERKFSDENISELERFLSKVPASHLKVIDKIKKVSLLFDSYACASPTGAGEEICLSDNFYLLDDKQREFVFFHEMGHNYFDYKDEWEGDMSILKFGECKKSDVKSLLRVQWLDVGKWDLDPENWKKVKSLFPINDSYKNKYTFTVRFVNPNKGMGEWTCPRKGRIKKLLNCGFRYNQLFYSPKEEMADAYALFILDRRKFEKQARKNEIIKKKYDFIAKCFSDNSKGKIEFERYNSC